MTLVLFTPGEHDPDVAAIECPRCQELDHPPPWKIVEGSEFTCRRCGTKSVFRVKGDLLVLVPQEESWVTEKQ